MSEQYEVTVYERSPVVARVSAGQVEAFLERVGWVGISADAFLMTDGGFLHPYKEWRLSRDPNEAPIKTWREMRGWNIAPVVERVAATLGRPLASVLDEMSQERA